MKTNFRTIVTAAIIGFISFTTNAQDFKNSLLSFQNQREIALAMFIPKTNFHTIAPNHSISNNAFFFANYLMEETEENLKLEDWMTDETTFNTFSVNTSVETEEELEIEAWMTSENYFNAALYIEEEAENQLELEDWMTNENVFNSESFSMTVESDANLEVENWMLDENKFEVQTQKSDKKIINNSRFVFSDVNDFDLEIENWMLDDKLFSNK